MNIKVFLKTLSVCAVLLVCFGVLTGIVAWLMGRSGWDLIWGLVTGFLVSVVAAALIAGSPRLGQTVQYLYFLRFSLILWLFPLAFALADSGRFPISTRTLTRGIFVPEYWAGYTCISFFLVLKGFAALASARVVAANGQERFAAARPDWVLNWLVDDKAQHERRPLFLCQIPNLVTLAYIFWNAIGEKVPWWQILLGIALGVSFALLFGYLLNAWYYLAYQPPVTPKTGDRVEIGKNAAQTILFPRATYRLREPGDAIPAAVGKETLEDVTTPLRTDWFAQKTQQWIHSLAANNSLPGYIQSQQQPYYLYETQIFSFVSIMAFLLLFWVLYPLTAPEPSWGAIASFAVILGWFLYMWSVFHRAKSGTDDKVARFWSRRLKLGAGIFCLAIPSLYFLSSPNRFPTLASVLLLVTILGWSLTMLSFYLDRYRFPVLLTFLLIAAAPRLVPIYGGLEEHYASTRTVANGDRAALRPPTPAQILDARLPDPSTGTSDNDPPFVIVTATGGGLHASAWTARVLMELNKRFGDGRAKDFRDHILLMSTVSGGSVGLSFYLREIDPASNGGQADFQRMVFSAQCSSLEAVGWGLLYYDVMKAIVPGLPMLFQPSTGVDDLEGTPMLKDRTWALRKGIERNTLDGYCRLTGNPLEKPGESQLKSLGIFLKTKWDLLSRKASLPKETLGNLRALAGFPAFTMNTTTAERGDRFLLANYRLPAYRIGSLEGEPAKSFLDLYHKEQSDLPIPTAAQLSATFPYVSSAVRLPSAGNPGDSHFVDGGYYDNDGTASAIEFLRYAVDAPVDAGSSDQDAGFVLRVRNKLQSKKLRVLLIEIRNSADSAPPTPAGKQPAPELANDTQESKKGLLAQLGYPLAGFWAAGHDSVTGRNRNGLDLLIQGHNDLKIHQVILDDISDQKASYGVIPAKDPLSWSLTPGERDEVMDSSKSTRLETCYKDVKDWFAADKWKTWNAEQGATRCGVKKPEQAH